MAYPHPALIELAAGRPLPAVADQKRLLDSALDHRMFGLLWRAAESGRFDSEPNLTEALAALSLRTEARNLLLQEALIQVNARLAAMEVEVVTFKGVTAEARWYERTGDRPTRDIDLLLGPSGRRSIGAILAVLDPEHPLIDTGAMLARRGHLQSVDVRHESGVWIDLHLDLLKYDLPTPQSDVIWERTVEHRLPNGDSIRVFDGEMSLINHLVHLNKDRFSHLLHLVDVAKILKGEELDWDFIDRFVHTEGLDTHVYSSLRVVTETLGIRGDFPEPAPGWRSLLWDRLWNERTRLLGDLGIAVRRRRQYAITYMIPGRTTEALVRGWHRLVPPRQLLDYYWPDLSGPYAVRIVRGRYGKGVERHQTKASLRARNDGGT